MQPINWGKRKKAGNGKRKKESRRLETKKLKLWLSRPFYSESQKQLQQQQLRETLHTKGY